MPRPVRAVAAAGISKRRAFQKPSPARMALLRKELQNPDQNGTITTTPSNNLYPNNTRLKRIPFTQLLSKRGTSGIHRLVPTVYIQFVCEFVNRFHGRNLAGQVPVCASLEANFFKIYYANFLTGQSNLATLPSLQKANLGVENFMQLRHLFLLDRTREQHVALIVISPLAKTVDYLDSANCGIDSHEKHREDNAKLGVVFNLLAEHLGGEFIPSEWSVRKGYSPYQGCTNDCAVYAMTNAFLVAFGYPVEYAGGDMLTRRQVIASELLNSADGNAFSEYIPGKAPADQAEFRYQLTDYWAGHSANARSRGFQHPSATILEMLDEDVRTRGR